MAAFNRRPANDRPRLSNGCTDRDVCAQQTIDRPLRATDRFRGAAPRAECPVLKHLAPKARPVERMRPTKSRAVPILATLPLDRLGVASAILCAAHCVLVPLLLAVLPVIGGGLVVGTALEWGFVTCGLGFGSLTLVPSFRRVHQRRLPLMLFAAGMGLWAAAHLGRGSDPGPDAPYMLTGAASLVSAHVANRRLCRACDVSSDSDPPADSEYAPHWRPSTKAKCAHQRAHHSDTPSNSLRLLATARDHQTAATMRTRQ